MKTVRLWLYSLVCRWMPETRLFGIKVRMLRWCGAKIGKNVRINSSAIFLGDGGLIIGDDVWIGAGCRIMPVGNAHIIIGSHCDLAPEVMILTGLHEIDVNGGHIGGKGISANVEIGDGCWLGARSTILPGVTIAKKNILAAGSVKTVSSEIEKSLWAGVPAKMKKQY